MGCPRGVYTPLSSLPPSPLKERGLAGKVEISVQVSVKLVSED